MKNLSKIIGIIAMAAVITFGIIACDDTGNSSGGSPTVTSVTVSAAGNATFVNKGSTLQFSASVSGANNPAQTFTWSIETAGTKAGTTISTDGLLTAASDETATTLTVRATFTEDNTKSGVATVTVNDPSLPNLSGNITISPAGPVETGTELTAAYSGSEPVGYQWKKDGVNVGIGTTKYRPSQAGSYTVTVSAEGCNSKISIPVTVTGSDNPPENWPAANRWAKQILPESTATLDFSVASDGVCTITIGGVADPTKWHSNVHYFYTAAAGKNYTYVFEAWTESGTRDLDIQYYHDFDTGVSLMGSGITINTTRQQYTVRGLTIPKEDGIRSLQFHGANQLGTFHVKVISITEYVLEELPAAERWSKSVNSESTATLEYSVGSDGVCTFTVGGTPMPNNQEEGWNSWRAAVRYSYTAKANTRYKYVLQAWTASGTGERYLYPEYYSDDAESIYLNSGITLTETPATCTIYGQKIPKGGTCLLAFKVADQSPGTFYVKVLSIEEYETGEVTITNYSGNPGLSGNVWAYGNAYAEDNNLSFSGTVSSSSSTTFDVYYEIYEGEDEDGAWNRYPFTGNVTLAAGDLWIRQYGSETTVYTNKVPITFTNGKATINFGTDMEVYEPPEPGDGDEEDEGDDGDG